MQKNNAEEKECEEILSQINSLFEAFDFEKAERLYLKNNRLLQKFNMKFDDLLQKFNTNYNRNSYIRTKRKKDAYNSLDGLLKDNDYLKSDVLFLENDALSQSEYEELKFDYIQKDLRILSEKIGCSFDEEKARVLAKTGKNILVKARAGSGKTTLVALKARQLMEHYGADPKEIMILAFNQKAAEEFQDRINKYCLEKKVDKSNSSTFHSLAYRIVNPGEQLLFNDNKSFSEFIRGQQSEFISKIYNKVLEEDRGTILMLLYNFFKALIKEKSPSEFDNKDDYYLYRRNLQYISLGGERVKSKGEKIIADFLFEHRFFKDGQELEYRYEWSLLGGKRPYKPDFSFWLLDKPKTELPIAILEYFGVTPDNPANPDYMSKDEERKYLMGTDWKKEYGKQRNIVFLSTSVDDLNGVAGGDRGHFEQILRRLLEDNGFVLQKLSQDDAIKKLLEAKNNLSDLFNQITQFISRAKKQLLSPSDLRALIDADDNAFGLRSMNFTKIACRVYERYQEQLAKENKIDFDDLLLRAINKIEQTNGDCEIEILGSMKPIKTIKYILIDEYQDFSKLFFKLIDAIIKINPAISVFCVGDDWQAINAFAGSEPEYFENFKSYFIYGEEVSLLTNHRSSINIVRHSNAVMLGYGEEALFEKSKSLGEVYLCSTPRVEWRSQQQYSDDYIKDEVYRARARQLGCWRHKDMEISRYLKIINKIVNDNISSEICFLFRTNDFYGLKIDEFQKRINEWYRNRPKIVFSTVHSYKGKESDVVVVVGVNRKAYPKIHPDNELMEILGVTLSMTIKEELHLFYVAVTRAREKLYMLYEDDSGYSDFIPGQWQYLTLNF